MFMYLVVSTTGKQKYPSLKGTVPCVGYSCPSFGFDVCVCVCIYLELFLLEYVQ